MAAIKPRVRKADTAVRTSVTVPKPHYQELERIAKGKRVSLAWVVREAIEHYVASQTPLFGGPRTQS